jgi:glucose/arabinose dehydrogenase
MVNPRTWLAIAAATMLCACGDDGPDPEPPASLALEEVASGLDFPTALAAPPGDERLFVLEKEGRVRIVKGGAVLPQPFLDLTGRLATDNEQGLLGITFDPAFASNRRLFVSYTESNGDFVVASYRASAADPDLADPASAVERLRIDMPSPIHHGGTLAFGPEGHLYVSMGDGGEGGCCDQGDRGQDIGDLFGSMLRLDVRGATGYLVPPDNPFVDNFAARTELWDYGLRNPWKFSFDRATGDLYISDVGQDAREEVNVARASAGGGGGANYGWPIVEGTACYRPATGCDRSGLAPPAVDYGHDEGCAVVGGYVYRGEAIAGLQGTYFYGDFCGGWVRSFTLEDGTPTAARAWPDLAVSGQLTGFGEDANGELYLLTASGTIQRIVVP